MTIAKKLVKVAENTPKVYEAGKQAESNAFWEQFQNNGKRSNYDSAFRNWGAEYITPKYPIKTITIYAMFNNCTNLKELPEIQLTAANSTYYSSFNECKALKEINMDILLSTTASALQQTFRNCISLVTIKKIVTNSSIQYANTFLNCNALVNVTFEGVIANDISFAESPLLSKESILNIFNCLATKTGCTVTLGSTNLAKLTDAEKAIATEKGWSLV